MRAPQESCFNWVRAELGACDLVGGLVLQRQADVVVRSDVDGCGELRLVDRSRIRATRVSCSCMGSLFYRRLSRSSLCDELQDRRVQRR